MLALETTRAHAQERNLNVAMTVADSAGNPLAFFRMDDAPAVAVELSSAKAYTALQMKTDTGLLQCVIDEGHPSYLNARALCLLDGGLPIHFGDTVIGAVGVSGADEDSDHAVAEFAVQTIEKLLSPL